MKWMLLVLGAAASLVQAAEKAPTIVLVHGALFTSQGWFLVQSKLQSDGISVATVDLPGRAADGVDSRTIDIEAATEKLCKVVRGIEGPVVLVGHSQGGAVITQALGNCGSTVKKLVYVAAVVPLDGETAFQGLDPARDVMFSKCVTLDESARLFRLNRQGPLEAAFFQDLRAIDAPLAELAVQSMVSEPAGIGTTPLHYDTRAFLAVAKYYVQTLEDRVVTPETQRSYQAKVHFTKIFSLPTGHSPFLSEPWKLAGILESVVR